jgi:misacylated tRNA(Ala) deacylase
VCATPRKRQRAPPEDPGIDLQPCGGTHVRNIGEIGAIRVIRIRSEGRRNRRVEIALS